MRKLVNWVRREIGMLNVATVAFIFDFLFFIVILLAALNARAEYYPLDTPDMEAMERARPCMQLIADGWQILTVRNEKGVMTKPALIQSINRSDVSPQLKAARLALVERVWDAPGDGWDFIGDMHRACMAEAQAGNDTKHWYY